MLNAEQVIERGRRRLMLRFIVSAPRSGGSGGTNNLPPILFHQVHGDNIRISRDGTVARRAESFCKGVTFSSRPIKVAEKVSYHFHVLFFFFSEVGHMFGNSYV